MRSRKLEMTSQNIQADLSTGTHAVNNIEANVTSMVVHMLAGSLCRWLNVFR